jgi:hypothetical protein
MATIAATRGILVIQDITCCITLSLHVRMAPSATHLKGAT